MISMFNILSVLISFEGFLQKKKIYFRETLNFIHIYI